MKLYRLKRFLLDLVYPNRCPFCDEFIAHNAYYCAECVEQLPLATAQKQGQIAVFEYNEQTSPFVYALKDGGNGYAIAAAAKLLCEGLAESAIADFGLLTCIPTDRSRLRERGYNPPALIARELSAMLRVPCDTGLLLKTRRTDVQKSLSAEQRRENIKGAFEVSPGKSFSFKGRRILLIDDVRTTGATLAEAAQVLLTAGASQVFTAVVASVGETKELQSE
ncbi:MAG: double zinc ribbon domain-containing protein [Oscillospiraceae bacterium]|nr:double zinc ribbon domain-containing protein [Oscillospiraceae bacterium]